MSLLIETVLRSVVRMLRTNVDKLVRLSVSGRPSALFSEGVFTGFQRKVTLWFCRAWAHHL